MTPAATSASSPLDLAQLDALTGGAFSAPTSGERAARLREWLGTEPAEDRLADVFREMSHRDKGAAKVVKEKLDDLRRARVQDAMAAEWAAKAQQLLDSPRLNLADAMAWQRDAAKAGAPLSREPLAGLKQALAERMKAVEDLQHRVHVEREAAVLLAQRIEVLSTKSWTEAQASLPQLQADVSEWQARATSLVSESEWASVEPRFPTQLQNAQVQLQVVWEAFQAALQQAVAASQDAAAPLPAVPVWATTVASVASRSVTVSVPLVLSTAFVSVRFFVSLVSVDTSSLPVMLIVTVAVPPSVVDTLNVSVTTWFAFSWLTASLVVYVHAPSVPITNVP